jgi:hypothetical protein
MSQSIKRFIPATIMSGTGNKEGQGGCRSFHAKIKDKVELATPVPISSHQINY